MEAIFLYSTVSTLYIEGARTNEDNERREVNAERGGKSANEEADEPCDTCRRATDARPEPLVQNVPNQSWTLIYDIM